MKKYLFFLLIFTLVACNQAEDESISESSTKSGDKKYSGDESSSEVTTKPFQKEEIAGEWEVSIVVASSNCEGKEINSTMNERWFVNFETGELNISVMDKGSKTKEYWGVFTGKKMEAIADKKLTKSEMQLLNEKNIQRNSLMLEVVNNNMISGKRVDISKDLCRTNYNISMKR